MQSIRKRELEIIKTAVNKTVRYVPSLGFLVNYIEYITESDNKTADYKWLLKRFLTAMENEDFFPLRFRNRSVTQRVVHLCNSVESSPTATDVEIANLIFIFFPEIPKNDFPGLGLIIWYFDIQIESTKNTPRVYMLKRFQSLN